ncbi:hypothetical protein JL721_10829 [Aureococcus anophagefferens]|nr:hypothetical protein JL721_10829 [Aureococcus anophagefferens]
MDGAVAYAAVEHVAWEARIGWGESSDEGSEGEPERAYRASAPGNAYLDAGDWAGARQRKRKRERGAGAHGEPAAARGTACPRSSTGSSSAASAAAQALFHGRCSRARSAAPGPWRPRADRAGGAARSARRAAPAQRRRAPRCWRVATGELRAADGELLLLELSEERPPLVANAGMAAALCRLRRARPADDRRQRRGRFGRPRASGRALALLGECAPDDEQLALVSDAFRAPVFPHGAPDAAAPVTDFLLCLAPRPRRARRDGPPEPWTWVVRPLDGDHLVALQGQVEPRIEVPPLGRSAPARRVSRRRAGAVGVAGAFDEPLALGARSGPRTAPRATAPRAGATRRSRSPSPRSTSRARSLTARVARPRCEIAVPLDEIQRALFCNTHVPAALLKRAVADVAEKVRGDGVDLWLPVRGVADGAGGAEKPASLAESRDAYQAQIAPSPLARRRALKRTLADMARGDDDEADDGRLLVGDREFRKRGKRGPYRNSTRFDGAERRGVAALGQQRRGPRRRGRRRAGAGARARGRRLGPRPSDLENDLLDDLAGGGGGDGRKAATARGREGARGPAAGPEGPGGAEARRGRARRAPGESGEPEAIRRPPRYAVRRVSRTFAGGREKVSVTFDVSEGAVERVAARTGVELPPERAPSPPRERHASPRPPPKPGSPRPGDGDLPNLDFLGGLDYLDGEQPLLPSEDLELRSEDLELAAGPVGPALADAEKDGGPAPKAKKGSVKLNISSLMAKHDEHKAEQRRAKEQRMKDDAASYHRRPAPILKFGQDHPNQRLNSTQVLTPLFRRPAPAGAFFKPVDKKQFPQYYVKITDPVDLTTIKERLGRYVYRARSALLKDLALMAANAAAFNGPAHPIALEGKAMVDAAEAAAADHADELDALGGDARADRALVVAAARAQGQGPRCPCARRAAGVDAAAAGRAPSPRDPPAARRRGAARGVARAAARLGRVARALGRVAPRANEAPPLALMGGEDSSSGEEEEMDGGAV